MKLACVVQRYGASIAGGSETHCRELAQRLAAAHDVTVLTSCARDYVTWANAFAPGETVEAGVRVIRFPVRRRRRLKQFADLSDEVFGGAAPRDRQDAWFAENGPDLPGLIDHLRAEGSRYDLVLFWTFRYAPSYFGVPLVAGRAVLVPTAEKDQAVDLEVLEEFFKIPAGFLFLTPEEEALVSTRAGARLSPAATIGAGLEPAPPVGETHALERLGVPPDFVLYLGRVDRNKGCDALLEYFQAFATHWPGTNLVLAGPATMQVPTHPRIHALGYVSDADRHALMSRARVLIVPSPYESLSMVLLEAWNQAVPVLVNAQCDVLKGQVRRGGGGLHYRSEHEFAEALGHLLAHDDERMALGRQGLSYVEREYRWPTVLGRVERLLADVRAQPPRAR